MRALIECAGCLAHGTPIPLSLLYTATNSAQNLEIKPALQQLIKIGFLRRADKETVLLTADGHRFLAERTRTERTRDAVELAVLMTANQLVEAEDYVGLAAIEKHLTAVVDAALPRADDKAVMLAATFLLCLMHLEAVDTIRNYLPRLEALEKASGFSILPAGLVERLTGKGKESVTVTQPMFTILQSIACLEDSQPVPLSLLYASYGPRSEIERAVAELAERGYLTQPDEDSILLTDTGRRLRQPIDPEIREGIVSGLVKVVKTAEEQGDKATLRRVRPHLQRMTDTALPEADEAAHHLVLTMVQCLVGLNELYLAATYMDQAEELEAALGLAKSDIPAVEIGEKAIQYHTQVAVHYFKQGEFGRARQHFEKAIATADDPELLPLLYQKLGNCCGELGDEMGKIQAYITVLKQALDYHGRDSWELTRYRNDLALVFIEYGQLEAAARHLQEALYQAERADVDTPHYLTETAKAHLLAAGIAYRQGQVKQGKVGVGRALSLARKLDGYWVSQAHLLYMAASLLNEYSTLDEARPLIEQGWDICQNHLDLADREAARIADLMADLYKQLN